MCSTQATSLKAKLFKLQFEGDRPFFDSFSFQYGSFNAILKTTRDLLSY